MDQRSVSAPQSIHPLTPEVVALMAAGEVIDSLSAVVRELVENALDAGATRISVSLWPQQWQVQVADNGCGMTATDLQQAAAAHTTSKIAARPDLLNLRSLGFRGEALHSIAQLAQLEICSRPADTVDKASQPPTSKSSTGYRACYSADGQLADLTEAAIASGTIVTVSHLFAGWQARRQTPSLSQQLKATRNLIQQLAICHPHITWQIQKENTPWLTLYPGKAAKVLLPQVLRNVYETDLKDVRADDLYLVAGLPDRCHRRKPDWVRVAINGRPVVVEEFSQALISGFRRTLPRDRFPICFLHLTLPSSQLDWNRHPAKSEIYVQGIKAVCDRIAVAVNELLQVESLSDSAQTRRATELVKAAEAAGNYSASRQISANENMLPAGSLSDALPGSRLPGGVVGELKAIAQVHNMYILAEHEAGLCLIEQHIAHERVLFEQLQQRWQMVPVEPPIVLGNLSETQIERLEEVGVAIAPFGENLWAVRSVPEPLAKREDCADALLELSLGANLEAALVATACRTAIRNGTVLTLPEMQTLVNQWQSTQKPRTCPHGRPICLVLKEASLAKYFRRSWVVGKSHGI